MEPSGCRVRRRNRSGCAAGVKERRGVGRRPGVSVQGPQAARHQGKGERINRTVEARAQKLSREWPSSATRRSVDTRARKLRRGSWRGAVSKKSGASGARVTSELRTGCLLSTGPQGNQAAVGAPALMPRSALPPKARRGKDATISEMSSGPLASAPRARTARILIAASPTRATAESARSKSSPIRNVGPEQIVFTRCRAKNRSPRSLSSPRTVRHHVSAVVE